MVVMHKIQPFFAKWNFRVDAPTFTYDDDDDAN